MSWTTTDAHAAAADISREVKEGVEQLVAERDHWMSVATDVITDRDTQIARNTAARDVLRDVVLGADAGPASTDLADVARYTVQLIRDLRAVNRRQAEQLADLDAGNSNLQRKVNDLAAALQTEATRIERSVTYRLPEWLGGREVDNAEIGAEYARVSVSEGDCRAQLDIPLAYLTTVEPPSIDDPVEVPLRIAGVDYDGNDSKLRIESSISKAPAKSVGYVGVVDTDAHSYLTAEQCRDAARALWKLGTGGTS